MLTLKLVIKTNFIAFCFLIFVNGKKDVVIKFNLLLFLWPIAVNRVAHLSCAHCHTMLVYPYGAPSVKCAICHYVMNIGVIIEFAICCFCCCVIHNFLPQFKVHCFFMIMCDRWTTRPPQFQLHVGLMRLRLCLHQLHLYAYFPTSC